MKTLWEKEKLLVLAISLFPKCFLLYQRQKLSFLLHLICRLLKVLFNLDQSVVLSYSEEFKSSCN